MKYCVRHTTSYSYSEVVPVCHNKVHLAPRSTASQNCVEFRLSVNPMPEVLTEHNDYFGNREHYFSIQESHAGQSITATSTIELPPFNRQRPTTSTIWEDVKASLANDRDHATFAALQFAFPSRHVPRDSRFAEYAQLSFSAKRPIVEACMDLTTRIFSEFTYDPKATTISTPVAEVLTNRAGVCQDFAHLQMACLRSVGLPARYVSGYLRTNPPPGQQRLVGADASHAWLSVFCGPLGWIDFDPTNNVIPSTDHITIAWGRDYDDVCPIKGVFVGGGDHKMSVSVDVEPLET